MKRSAILIMIIALACPLMAEGEGWRALKGVYFSLHAVDLGLTYSGLNGGLSEINPAVKWYAESPGLGFAVSFGLMAAVNWGIDEIRARNKTLGWVVLGVLTAFKCYVIWHNIGILGEKRF